MSSDTLSLTYFEDPLDLSLAQYLENWIESSDEEEKKKIILQLVDQANHFVNSVWNDLIL